MSSLLGICAPYCLRDVVYYHSAVCISVVHGSQRLVALLSRCVPNLELDCRLIVQGKGLCEESGADSGLSVVIELILFGEVNMAIWVLAVVCPYRTFTKRSTSELFPTADSPSECQYAVPWRFGMRLLLTQKHKLELCEPRAAGATTLLHTLGHGWAWWRMSAFALWKRKKRRL